MHVNVFALAIEVKLFYISGKKIFFQKNEQIARTTKAMKKWNEATERRIKASEKYFQHAVKFLLNWKCGFCEARELIAASG